MSSRPSTGASTTDGQGDATVKKTVGHYLLGPTLGEGTFGRVKMGTHVLTSEKVAIKLLEKSKIKEVADVERVSREINILKRIRHRNVIQLFEVIDTPKQIFLVMEYSDGGELFDYIVKHKRVPEPQAAAFMQDICNGLEYLHSVNVIHRDLKPENLLMHRTSSGWTIKIIDFGLSNTCDGGRLLKTACGSPCYAAPEMIAGHKYVGSMTDMWSLGVVLFALVCGYLPFEHENTAKLYQKILNGDYTTPDFVSSQVKDLIRRILETNPRKRYTMEDVRRHPWFRQATPSVPTAIRVIPSSYTEVSAAVMKQVLRLGLDVKHVADSVIRNAHNHASTTYYLIAERLMREGLPLFDKTDNFSWVPDVTSSPALTTPPGGDELVDGSTTNAGGPNSSSSAGVGIRPTRPGDDDIRADALVPSVGYSSRPASSSYGAGGGANSQGGDSATFAPYYGPAPGTARGRGSVHEGVPARSPRVHSSLSRPQRERNRRVSSVSPRPVPPRASSVASNDPRGQKSPAAPVVADATGPASDSKAARAALIYSSYRPTSSYWPPQPSARGGTSGTGLPAPAPTGKQPSRAGTPSRREENAGPIPGRPTPPSSPKGATSVGPTVTLLPLPSSRPVSTYGVRLGPISSSDTGGTGSTVPAGPPSNKSREVATTQSTTGSDAHPTATAGVVPHPPQSLSLFAPRAPEAPPPEASKDGSDGGIRSGKMWGGRRIREVPGTHPAAVALLDPDSTTLEDADSVSSPHVKRSVTPSVVPPITTLKVPSRPVAPPETSSARAGGRTVRYSFTGVTTAAPATTQPSTGRTFGFAHRVVQPPSTTAKQQAAGKDVDIDSQVRVATHT